MGGGGGDNDSYLKTFRCGVGWGGGGEVEGKRQFSSKLHRQCVIGGGE